MANDGLDETPLEHQTRKWLVAEVKSLSRMFGHWKADELRKGQPDANDKLRARVRALEETVRRGFTTAGVPPHIREVFGKALAAGEAAAASVGDGEAAAASVGDEMRMMRAGVWEQAGEAG